MSLKPANVPGDLDGRNGGSVAVVSGGSGISACGVARPPSSTNNGEAKARSASFGR